jgi:hypothetical protein
MEGQPGDGVSRSLQLDVYCALTNDISLLLVDFDAMLTARLCQVQQPLLSNCNVDWSLVNPVYNRLPRLHINRLHFELEDYNRLTMAFASPRPARVVHHSAATSRSTESPMDVDARPSRWNSSYNAAQEPPRKREIDEQTCCIAFVR